MTRGPLLVSPVLSCARRHAAGGFAGCVAGSSAGFGFRRNLPEVHGTNGMIGLLTSWVDL